MWTLQNLLLVAARRLIRKKNLFGQPARLIGRMHQFKFNTVVKYPKRDVPNDSQIEQIMLEQRNIHQTSVARMAERKNYYNILGVKKDSTLKDIKKAYYVLAKKYHPDSSKVITSPESDKKFQEISEAYRILSDDSKRLEYDLYGVVKSIKKQLPGSKGDSGDNSEKKLHKVMEKAGLLHDSKEFDPPHPIEIPDETLLKLTFTQSIRGCVKDITVKTMKRCPRCAGITETVFKKNLVMCEKCNGSGLQAITTKAHMVRGPCQACNGRRYVPQKTCAECSGRGIILVSKQIEVNIPPGVNSGDIIRVQHPNKQQQIAIRLLVAKSGFFTRIGNDIHSELPITLSQAVLGGIVKVKGLTDDHEINLEPGTETDSKIRLVGRGVKTNSEVGDHILTVKVKIPKTLTAKQRSLMIAYAEMEADAPDLKAELRKSKIKDELATLHNLNTREKQSSVSSFSTAKSSNNLSTKRIYRDSSS